MNEIRIALLHLNLKAGLLALNFTLLEQAICAAAAADADWIITPELCISGYQFNDLIGTGWIKEQPDEWMTHVCSLARSLRRVIWFAHPERDSAGNLYNSVFIIDASGTIIGRHRKINTAAEPWASPGRSCELVLWNTFKIGTLICSDAYTSEITQALCLKGAQLFVSPAAWAPGLNGPDGEWEQRTIETGLSLIVCNRTGTEQTLSFELGESLVIRNGERLLAHRSQSSALLLFNWDLEKMTPNSSEFQVEYLPSIA
jgi:predicted amidohydrolase